MDKLGGRIVSSREGEKVRELIYKGVEAERFTYYQLMSEESGYRKINKQMKFEFLRKVLGQGLTIFEAAQQIGIHYSTAKTIVFFHKHKHKSYRGFKLNATPLSPSSQRAQFRLLESQDPLPNIPVISNNRFQKWEPRKEVKAGNIALTYLRNERQSEKLRELEVEAIKLEKKSSECIELNNLEDSSEDIIEESEEKD